MKKRRISLALSLVLVLTMTTPSAFANDADILPDTSGTETAIIDGTIDASESAETAGKAEESEAIETVEQNIESEVSETAETTETAELSDTIVTVKGGDTIASDGEYRIAADAAGTIKIEAGITATLQGSGKDAESNKELSIQCGEGVTLTLKDLFVQNSTNINLINFTGKGNILKAKGTNVLETDAYNSSAVIHVGPEAELTFDDGGGVLYLYKKTQGSGIGSNAEEANGKMTFAGGLWFIKGTKTGAVIGNDTCGDAEKAAQIGDITISGGQLYVEANARGSAIGGSSMSGGGNVYLTGGTLTIYNDYSGSAIGAGQSARASGLSSGTLTITGGSLKTYITPNASGEWNVDSGCNDIAVQADKTNGSNVVYKYALDVSGQTAPYSISVDGKAFYTGGLHDYEYTKDTEDTTANWTKTGADKNLYLYLTEGTHSISVNGGEAQEITVTKTVYDEDWHLEVPSETWSDHADKSWYSADTNDFTINSAAQLAGLAEIVNAGTDDFTGKTIKLNASISIENYQWIPIGTEEHPFKGTFDGNGNKIEGLLIEQLEKSCLGLFGFIDSAAVENVTVRRGYAAGYHQVGGISGFAMNSSFSCCINEVQLYAQFTGATGGGMYGNNVGGIVGKGYNCTVSNCENKAKVKGNRNIGGIAGRFSGTMTDCINNGICIARNEYCGGMIGQYNDSADTGISWFKEEYGVTITGCTNNASISGLTASGILGSAVQDSDGEKVIIRSCTNNADIDCGKAGGGITSLGSRDRDIDSIIEDCVNNGNISSSRGDGDGVGGIVGYFVKGTVKNCRNTGNVIGGDTLTIGHGGIVGAIYIGNESVAYEPKIVDCYNSGKVTVSTTYARAGALIGIVRYICGEQYYNKKKTKKESQEKFDKAITNLSNNKYVFGAADGAIGTFETDNGERRNWYFEQRNIDIEGRAEIDADTIKTGDIDGDGEITAKDASALAKYLVGLSDMSSAYIKASDVNKDGSVDAKDASRLAKYLVGALSSL